MGAEFTHGIGPVDQRVGGSRLNMCIVSHSQEEGKWGNSAGLDFGHFQIRQMGQQASCGKIRGAPTTLSTAIRKFVPDFAAIYLWGILGSGGAKMRGLKPTGLWTKMIPSRRWTGLEHAP
jgi:hypothetical protein